MSDTPVSTVEPQTPERSFWGRLADGRARALFGTAYAIAFLITAAAIWLVAIAPGATAGGDARTAASQAVFGRYTIDSGELDVRPDPAAPGAGYDPRSHARRVLDAINALNG